MQGGVDGKSAKMDLSDQMRTVNLIDRGIMNIENTKAQMRKGVLEYCILSILRDKDKYASEILEALKDAKMLVVEGTIYPLLTRLKNAGLLNYRWEESTSGPPRKYYALTETGQLFLKELNGTWEELRNAVNLVTNTK
jgi:PadR family transcriptional regulator PadR